MIDQPEPFTYTNPSDDNRTNDRCADCERKDREFATCEGLLREAYEEIAKLRVTEPAAEAPKARHLYEKASALASLTEYWERMASQSDAAVGHFEGPTAATLNAEVTERGSTLRKAASDVREVLRTGCVPHDLMPAQLTHYGNDPMGAPTTHVGIRDNCPAPECGPDLVRDEPEIVVLCGSTEFIDEFIETNLRLTAGDSNTPSVIVLSLGCNLRQPHELWADPQDAEELKLRLDAVHKAKIRLADRVVVVGTRIGTSTTSEIEYARALGKPVTFLHPHVDPDTQWGAWCQHGEHIVEADPDTNDPDGGIVGRLVNPWPCTADGCTAEAFERAQQEEDNAYWEALNSEASQW